MRVSRVILDQDAPRELAKALLIDVNANTPMDTLTQHFHDYRGTCPVYLNVETSDALVAQIECSPGMRVSCTTEFLHKLAEIVGRASICVLGPGRKAIPIRTPLAIE